jgi:ankyrin repeat protein
MKRFGLIAIAAAVALSAPATAQYVSDAEGFISAVRSRDGNRATEIIGTRPTIVNSRNLKGETALIIAISRSDETWTLFLLGKGADPNLPAGNGDTPLIAAARVGYVDAAEWLLRRGAKVDAANKMGETALIIAVQQRQLPVVELLLQMGADPDKTDSAAGYSARDYAKRDTRNREILAAIDAAKTRKSAKPNELKLDDFKLN